MIYVLKLKYNGYDLKELVKNIPDEFFDYSYMIGFLDGYLMKQYRLYTMLEFEIKINNTLNIQDNSYFKFLTIE